MPDFNGDGRGDVSYSKTTKIWNPDLQIYKYTFSFNVICPGGMTYSTNNGYSTAPVYGDFNGDGRTDILYIRVGVPGSGTYRARFSTGTSFTAEVAGPDATIYGSPNVLLDWDGDGNDDLLIRNASTGNLDFFRSTGQGFATPISTGMSASFNWGGLNVADVNGDGLADLTYGSGYDANSVGTEKIRLHPGVFPDLLLTATDGFGLSATFNYAPISQSNYTKGTGATFPDQDYQGPTYVVNTVTASTGIQSPSTYTQTYSYSGGRRNMQGRGFVGFDKKRMTDSRNGLYVDRYFRRDFPYIGMVYESDLLQSNGTTTIRRTQNTPSTLTTFNSAFETRVFPYMGASSLDSYEFGGTRNAAWLAHGTMAVGAIDSFGNATSVTTTVQDMDSLSPWTSETYTQVTTSTITNDAVNWCLGRPTQMTTQSTLPDASSQTRTVGATVDYPKCRDTQRTVEPSGSALNVTTNFYFNDPVACGNPTSVEVIGKTPAGATMPSRTTSFNYGLRCQFPEIITNALSQATTIGYRYDLGLQSSVTDPNILPVSRFYDDFGRPTQQTQPDSTYSTLSLALCNAGNSYCSQGATDLRYKVTETQYAFGGAVIRTAYSYQDGFDRPRFSDAQNLTGGYTHVVTTYDSLGRTLNVTAPYSTVANGSRQWIYDAINRVTVDGLYTSGGALDRQSTIAYTGRYLSITDPKNNVTQTYIDVRGLLRRLVDPSPGGTTNYAFDPYANLASVTDPAGNVQSWGYNLRGFTTSSSDPDRGNWSYSTNSLGEPVSQTDAKTQTVTFGAFDGLGRPTTRVEAEGTTTWTWGTLADNTPSNKYVGRLRSVSGPGYSENYAFDSLGRPLTTTINADDAYQVDYAYNTATGFVDNVTYPTSTAGYRLRAQYLYQYGIPYQVRDYNVPSTVWWQLNAMDDRANPIDEQLANGVHILANNDGLTGHLNWRASGTNGGYSNQQNLTFNWDKNENLTDRIDVNQASLTEHFAYDALNRLDYSTLNGTTNLDITLDPIGNITAKTSATNSLENIGTYTYHATKKHAVASTNNGTTVWNFTYDSNGNMQTGRGSIITWTSYNLPASIANGSNSSAFSYTPDRQYWKQVAQYGASPETTIYVGDLLEKVTSNGGTDYRHMIQAGSATIIVTRSTGTNNGTYYVTQDHLTSNTVVTNSAGAVVVSQSYSAYGMRRGSNWTGSPSAGDLSAIANVTRRGYTQHTELDNLGLIHMNGRVYDPAIGRFMSADPFTDGTASSQGYNRYSYVGNSPLTFIDPTGFGDEDPVTPPTFDPCVYGFCNPDIHGKGPSHSPQSPPSDLWRPLPHIRPGPRIVPSFGVPFDFMPSGGGGVGGGVSLVGNSGDVAAGQRAIDDLIRRGAIIFGEDEYGNGRWWDTLGGAGRYLGDQSYYALMLTLSLYEARAGNIHAAKVFLSARNRDPFGEPESNLGQLGYEALGPIVQAVLGGVAGGARVLVVRALATAGEGAAAAARGIGITERGLAHALERHTVSGALNAGKSVFSAGENVAGLVRTASGVQRVGQAGGNFERIIDAGRTIGIDRASGQPTSIYTVITNAADDLITAFPGRP